LSFSDVTVPGPPGLDVVFQRHYNSKAGWSFGLAGVPMRIEGELGNPPPPRPVPVSDWVPKFRMAWSFAVERLAGRLPVADLQRARSQKCRWA
jgi:hypothetical protein